MFYHSQYCTMSSVTLLMGLEKHLLGIENGLEIVWNFIYMNKWEPWFDMMMSQ